MMLFGDPMSPEKLIKAPGFNENITGELLDSTEFASEYLLLFTVIVFFQQKLLEYDPLLRRWPPVE